MKIELRPPSDIQPYPGNPRKNDGAVDAVARSIGEFGFRQPIVVDRDGVIVVGHTRWKAAIKLGLEKVPVHVALDMTPEAARAYRIADNATGLIADWDKELLPLELGELEKVDFDLSALGFDPDDLARFMNRDAQGGLVDPDSVPAPPEQAVTTPGDLWILGDHRLLCGDSAKAEDVDRLLDGAAIHLVNTDPPYNVRVEPRSNNAIAAGLSTFHPVKQGTPDNNQKFDLARHPEKVKPTHGRLRAKDRFLENDCVSEEEFDRLLDAWFGNIARVLLPGRGFYIWGGYANCANYPPVLKRHGLYFSQAIIWHKQHPVLSRKDYMGDHEWCQPGDVSVLTPEGHVPISSIREGDRVVSFRRSDSMLTGRRGSVPVSRATRHYSGQMACVRAGGRETWCTPGHIWSVKLAPCAADLWCVYVMRRGDWWRVGKSRLISSWGFGVKHRLKTEDGEAAWILSVHGSSLEATLHEQEVQARYGLPTTTWSESYASRRTIADVARLYERLDLAALQAGAVRALQDHGRDLAHPFLERARVRAKVGRRTSLTVRACNLIPEAMQVPIVACDGEGRARWTPIDSIGLESFDGPVHSLDVPGLRHYVADGMVTHNCFYGWREGAAHVFLGPNNVPDVWPVKKVNPQSMIHLTEKPTELAVRAMQYSSREGENVLDLFGGSGSTLIAAEQTRRRAFLMEIDTLYCDVIVQRWEQFTGRKAERRSAAAPEADGGA